MSEIYKPADWENSSMEDLLSCEAGRAYVLDQLDSSSKAIQPEQVFQSSRKNCDAAWYKIYSDGSLWFVNNAQDEVWSDYTDFVQQSLLPGIAASAAQKGMCWDEEEAAESDDFNAWSLDQMDREILTKYADDDEEAARELVGLGR